MKSLLVDLLIFFFSLALGRVMPRKRRHARVAKGPWKVVARPSANAPDRIVYYAQHKHYDERYPASTRDWRIRVVHVNVDDPVAVAEARFQTEERVAVLNAEAA